MNISDQLTRLARGIISAEQARHVLHAYGSPGGYQAGSFTTNLIECFQTADPHNFATLSRSYPGYGAAVTLAREHQDGIAILDRIAAGS